MESMSCMGEVRVAINKQKKMYSGKWVSMLVKVECTDVLTAQATDFGLKLCRRNHYLAFAADAVRHFHAYIDFGTLPAVLSVITLQLEEWKTRQSLDRLVGRVT